VLTANQAGQAAGDHSLLPRLLRSAALRACQHCAVRRGAKNKQKRKKRNIEKKHLPGPHQRSSASSSTAPACCRAWSNGNAPSSITTAITPARARPPHLSPVARHRTHIFALRRLCVCAPHIFTNTRGQHEPRPLTVNLCGPFGHLLTATPFPARAACGGRARRPDVRRARVVAPVAGRAVVVQQLRAHVLRRPARQRAGHMGNRACGPCSSQHAFSCWRGVQRVAACVVCSPHLCSQQSGFRDAAYPTLPLWAHPSRDEARSRPPASPWKVLAKPNCARRSCHQRRALTLPCYQDSPNPASSDSASVCRLTVSLNSFHGSTTDGQRVSSAYSSRLLAAGHLGGRAHVAELDHRRLLVVQERVVQLEVPARQRRVRHERFRATPPGQRAGCARMALRTLCTNLTITQCTAWAQSRTACRSGSQCWAAQVGSTPGAASNHSRVPDVESQGAAQAGAPVSNGVLVAVRNGVDELLRGAAAQPSMRRPAVQASETHMRACCAVAAADACAGSEHEHVSTSKLSSNATPAAGHTPRMWQLGEQQGPYGDLGIMPAAAEAPNHNNRTGRHAAVQLRMDPLRQGGLRRLQRARPVGRVETLHRQRNAARRAAQRTRKR